VERNIFTVRLRFELFGQIFTEHAQKGHISTFGPIFTLNLKFLWAFSYSTANFGGDYAKIWRIYKHLYFTISVATQDKNLGWKLDRK